MHRHQSPFRSWLWAPPTYVALVPLYEKSPTQQTLVRGRPDLRPRDTLLEVFSLCWLHAESDEAEQAFGEPGTEAVPLGWPLAFSATPSGQSQRVSSLTQSPLGSVASCQQQRPLQKLAPRRRAPHLDKGDATIRSCCSEADHRAQGEGPRKGPGGWQTQCPAMTVKLMAARQHGGRKLLWCQQHWPQDAWCGCCVLWHIDRASWAKVAGLGVPKPS